MAVAKNALQWKMANFSESLFVTALDPEVEQYGVGMRFTPSIHPTTRFTHSPRLLLTTFTREVPLAGGPTPQSWSHPCDT